MIETVEYRVIGLGIYKCSIAHRKNSNIGSPDVRETVGTALVRELTTNELKQREKLLTAACKAQARVENVPEKAHAFYLQEAKQALTEAVAAQRAFYAALVQNVTTKASSSLITDESSCYTLVQR